MARTASEIISPALAPERGEGKEDEVMISDASSENESRSRGKRGMKGRGERTDDVDTKDSESREGMMG